MAARTKFTSPKNARILLLSGGLSFVIALAFSLLGLVQLYGSATCNIADTACQTGVVKLPLALLIGQELLYAAFVIVAIGIYFMSRAGVKDKKHLKPIKRDVQPIVIIVLVGIASCAIIAQVLNPALSQVPEHSLLIASLLAAVIYPLCALATLYGLEVYQPRAAK